MTRQGKVTAMTVEKTKTPIDVDGKLAQRQKLAEDLKKKLEDFEKELETKQYLVEGKLEIATKLHDFITTEAEWKFSESLGIIETSKQIAAIKDSLEKGKTKEVMLSHLALEAFYYFLSKLTGKGLESAQAHVQLLKPIADSLGRAKQDRDKKDQLVKDLGTIESAIDAGAVSDIEETLIAEIEAETAQ
jgi:hypothetical protein